MAIGIHTERLEEEPALWNGAAWLDSKAVSPKHFISLAWHRRLVLLEANVCKMAFCDIYHGEENEKRGTGGGRMGKWGDSL